MNLSEIASGQLYGRRTQAITLIWNTFRQSHLYLLEIIDGSSKSSVQTRDTQRAVCGHMWSTHSLQFYVLLALLNIIFNYYNSHVHQRWLQMYVFWGTREGKKSFIGVYVYTKLCMAFNDYIVFVALVPVFYKNQGACHRIRNCIWGRHNTITMNEYFLHCMF